MPEILAKRLKSGTVDPLKTTTVHAPLPQLPEKLLDKQKSLTELREMSSKQQSHSTAQPRPSGTVNVAGDSDVQRITSLSLRRKGHVSGISKKRSSSLLLRSDPNTVLTCYSPPLESLTDPLEIVERLKREPELGFLYLTPVDDHKSIRYNPYNLRYGIIHCTISQRKRFCKCLGNTRIKGTKFKTSISGVSRILYRGCLIVCA